MEEIPSVNPVKPFFGKAGNENPGFYSVIPTQVGIQVP
jgi:hypothetical protein